MIPTKRFNRQQRINIPINSWLAFFRHLSGYTDVYLGENNKVNKYLIIARLVTVRMVKNNEKTQFSKNAILSKNKRTVL